MSPTWRTLERELKAQDHWPDWGGLCVSNAGKFEVPGGACREQEPPLDRCWRWVNQVIFVTDKSSRCWVNPHFWAYLLGRMAAKKCSEKRTRFGHFCACVALCLFGRVGNLEGKFDEAGSPWSTANFTANFASNQWEPMGTNGNQWEPMGTNGNQWEPMGTNGNQWEPIEVPVFFPRCFKSTLGLGIYVMGLENHRAGNFSAMISKKQPCWVVGWEIYGVSPRISFCGFLLGVAFFGVSLLGRGGIFDDGDLSRLDGDLFLHFLSRF